MKSIKTTNFPGISLSAKTNKFKPVIPVLKMAVAILKLPCLISSIRFRERRFKMAPAVPSPLGVLIIAALLFMKISAIASPLSFATSNGVRLAITKLTSIPQDTIVTGVVRSATGKLLGNATILVNAKPVTTTDADGRFSFDMPHPDQPANIFFEYDSMTTGVRSYYPSMGNTSYDVTLKKTECCCNWRVLAKKRTKLPAISFAKSGITVQPAQQDQLNDIANQLKEDPAASIFMIAHPGHSKAAQRLAAHRLESLKTQLVEQLGISADRIQTKVSTDTPKSEAVEFEWKE